MRAGPRTRFSFGDSLGAGDDCEDDGVRNQYMWYSSYSGAPVDGSAWVSPAASYRVVRGGGWLNLGQYCRSASRRGRTPTHRGYYLGLRLAAVRQVPEALPVEFKDAAPRRQSRARDAR